MDFLLVETLRELIKIRNEEAEHKGEQRIGGGWKRCTLLSLLLFVTPPVFASTSAEILRTKAQLAYSSQQYREALSLLDTALQEDGSDLLSLYYRGLTHARLREYEQALADLEQVMRAGADYPSLSYELGMVAFHKGDYTRAVSALKLALKAQPQRHQIAYYLSVSYHRLHDYAAALAVLRQSAVQGGAMGVASLYLQAESLYHLGRYDEAREILQQILSDHGQSPYAERARRLNEKLAVRRGILTELDAQLSVGVVHDSNVALYSDELPLPTSLSERADNRWQLGLQLKWTPPPSSSMPVALGYHLFQSRHQILTDYDLRSHALSADWKQELAQGEWGVGYRYVKASLDNYDYVDTHQLTPYLLLPHGEQRLSFAKFQWSSNRYSYPSMGGYDGNRFSLNYRYFWLQGDKRYLATGFDLGSERTEDDNLSSRRYGVNASAQWDWQKILASLNLQYLKREFPDALIERSDSVVKVGLRLRYHVGQHTEFETTVNYINNASTRSAYDYGRTVYGVNMKWKL